MQSTQQTQSPLIKSMTFDDVRYSLVWEDPALLSSGLDVQAGEKILSIGSAGCNALAMLLTACDQVTAIDLSPAQIALMELKKAAIKKLTFVEFMSLLGLQDPSRSWELYQSLRSELNPDHRDFFDSKSPQFSAGLSFQGRLEKFFFYFNRKVLVDIWHPQFISQCLEVTDLAEQWKLIQSDGNLEKLKEAVVDYFGREGLEKGRDPEQMKYVSTSNIGNYFYQKFINTLQNQLVRENHFLYLFITGKFPQESFRPPTYQEQNFHLLKEKIDSFEIIHSDLESYLSKSGNTFHKMNLSDIFEYLSPEQTDQLFQSLSAHLEPKGRIAYWSLLVDRLPPRNLEILNLKNLPADRLWFYKSFHVLEKAAAL